MSFLTLQNVLKRVPLPHGHNGSRTRAAVAEQELPFRSELFSLEQLQIHAKVLAGWHKLAEAPGRDRLLGRLAENEQILHEAFVPVSNAVIKGKPITPGGEWLIDNFYIIEEQIRTARRHLPRTYSRQLPQLSNGPAAGMPRVYHLALELIAHLDGRVAVDSVTHFIASYQVSKTLHIGELWAVPIMLRLALLENLRRIAARIAGGRRDSDLADIWADRLLKTAENEPANLILVLADMARSNPPLSPSFVATYARQLQGKSPALAFALAWVEQRLSEQAQSIEQQVQLEAQQQAANQVSMGNSISSLRELAAIDWRDFVEGLSVIEQTLRRDPAAIYSAMDFATRDRYRHAVENIAKRSQASEEDVARQVIALATDSASGNGVMSRQGHVGYYLVGKGLPSLERAVTARIALPQRMARWIERTPLVYYLGPILGITAIISLGLARYAAVWGLHGWALGALILLLILCTSQLAVALVNWAVTCFMPPRKMPRMDFSKGIASQYPTMVVVPTMLSNPRGVQDLLEGLEIRYLANRDPQLYFALLTDFKDAAAETLPEDAGLLQAARDGIAELNDRHGQGDHLPFFLFHRPRRWNACEKRWMGYERKRGKLGEFNAVLRGGPIDRFSAVLGDTSVLPTIKYVITLDTDTELPRDSARQLVATMAHPLVKAQFDSKTGGIGDGYAILQPRVAISLPSANRSWFAKLFAGEPGIDPYTRVVSDVYQDMFQEGSYIGKGIYDVDAFEKILGHRFPDNRILSHDLLEGSHARTGLVSDILLYEDHPWHYSADMRRRHRWIRGDWQIATWLLPKVPGRDDLRLWNPLSWLSRWKILDNLRRSLTAVALLVLLLVGWTILPMPAFWTAVVLAIVVTPVLLVTLVELFRKPEGFGIALHVKMISRQVLYHIFQVVFTLIFLPYETLVNLDAILRTLYRTIISHRRLLEWETASDAQYRARHDLGSFLLTMLTAPLLAVLVEGLLLIVRPESMSVATPLLALWIVSPGIAWLISQPLRRQKPQLNHQQQNLLRILARRTWRVF